MDHQFRYRKHIRQMRILTLITLLLLAIFFGVGAFVNGISELYIFTIIFTLEAVVLWKILGRFTYAKITMGEELITYTLGKRETIIPYEQITKIQIFSIRYMGGWIKIKSPKKTIRLTVAVENIPYLIQLLKVGLDSKGMAIYNPKKLFRFLKTSAFADESWARIYRIWWKLALFTIVTAIIGIAISIVLDLSGGTVFFATLFPTIVYVITEFIFKLRIRRFANLKEFSVPERDVMYERKIYKKALIWSSLVFVIWMLSIVLLL